jgi:hypothetical protein
MFFRTLRPAHTYSAAPHLLAVSRQSLQHTNRHAYFQQVLQMYVSASQHTAPHRSAHSCSTLSHYSITTLWTALLSKESLITVYHWLVLCDASLLKDNSLLLSSALGYTISYFASLIELSFLLSIRNLRVWAFVLMPVLLLLFAWTNALVIDIFIFFRCLKKRICISALFLPPLPPPPTHTHTNTEISYDALQEDRVLSAASLKYPEKWVSPLPWQELNRIDNFLRSC